MATHPDYVIANASGAAVRDDLNKALAAIVSNNSSATDPATSTTTYPHQWWYDTIAGQLKLRNAANDGWVVVPVLDSSDRLLLGTSSSIPVGNIVSGFQSYGDETEPGRASFACYSSSFVGAIISLGKSKATSVGSTGIVSSGDILGEVRFAGDDGVDMNSYGALIKCEVDGDPGANDMPGRLVFSTTADGASSPTERIRINSAGKVGIGTSIPFYALDVVNGIGITEGSALNWHNGSGSNSAQIYGDASDNLIFRNTSSDTERMRIDSTGLVEIDKARCNAGGGLDFLPSTVNRVVLRCRSTSTGTVSLATFGNPNGTIGSISTGGSATSFNTSSDYRLKENIIPVTDGITRLQQLKPSRFNFIADPDTTVDGFIAHEAQAVVPECVTGTHDEVEVWSEGEELPDGVSVGDNKLDEAGNTIPIYQGIDQSKLVPLLTAALQEAISKIETLEAKVAALEAA